MDEASPQLLDRQHQIIKKARRKIHALASKLHQPIAIVGMGCRMPGAETVGELWELLLAGREALSEVPAERWNIEDYYSPTPATPRKTYCRRAGYLKDIAKFDARFFGISPREAQQMDPQQRLLLQVSYQAFEHARIPVTALYGESVGVFIGISSSEYAVMTFSPLRASSQDAYSITGTSMNSAAGRLAYFYGFHGPALAIDTACSSSLVVIHQAAQSLIAEECHTALAGGVNCLLTPQPSIALAQNKVLSATGRCSPFSAQADGLVRGEGCGILVLKRLSDAIVEGCRILGVVRAGHVNQDGASSGLTVPNGYAQQSLIRHALHKAKLQARDIRYVEAHGTGTSLGDPIELNALGHALSVGSERSSPLLLGSIKANLGHLEAASGVAGVLKVVLGLQHRCLPRQIHVAERTTQVDWESLGLDVVNETTPIFFDADTPFYAGVSSFGFSGTNAHLILQDPVSAVATSLREARATGLRETSSTALRETVESTSDHDAALSSTAQFLGISAKEPCALQKLLAEYHALLSREPHWRAVCEAANRGRAHYRYRRGFVAKTREALLEQLASASEAQSPEPSADGPRLAWLFTGQGSQYLDMGRALFDAHPQFAARMRECDAALSKHVGRSILAIIHGEEGALLNQTRYTQPAIFCLQYALSQYLLSLNLHPQFVLGHSIGEYAAAVLAGVFNLEDAARMIAYRGRLMDELCGAGKMLVVFADEHQVRSLVASAEAEVDIAAINGPDNHVLSGWPQAIDQVSRRAESLRLRVFELSVSRAFHSRMMEPMLPAFREIVRRTTFSAPRVELVSSTLGSIVSSEIADPEYWVAHVREPVRFQRAVTALFEPLRGDSRRLACLEIGPHEQLLNMVKTFTDAKTALWLPWLRPQDDLTAFARGLKTLYESGVPLAWSRRSAPTKLSLSSELPAYPFEEQQFWLADAGAALDLPRGGLYRLIWQDAPPISTCVRPLSRRWLIVSCNTAFAKTLAAELTRAGGTVREVLIASLTSDFATETSAALTAPTSWTDEEIVFCPSSFCDNAEQLQARLYTFIQLIRNCRDALIAGRMRLHCVVDWGPEGFGTAGACYAGIRRSLRQEDPDLRFRLIGLDCAMSVARQVRAFLAEVSGDPADEGAAEIGLEEDRRVRPRLVESESGGAPPEAANATIRSDRTYLITGGTGIVGRICAQALLHAGARTIVLISRRAAQAAEQARSLVTLAAGKGANLVFHSADVANDLAMQKLFKELSADYPPLAGVIHAAGRIDDCAFWRLTRRELEQVFAPKVKGAQILDRLTRDQSLDFFVLISSIAATLGAAGQANYAAANAFLEGLCAERRALGLPGSSVGLGPVEGSAMVSGASVAANLERSGLQALSPDWLQSQIETLLTRRSGQWVLAHFDWPRIRAREHAARWPILDAFLPAAPQPAAPATEGNKDVSHRGAPQSQQAVADMVRESIAAVLRLPGGAALRDSDTLSGLGMDSITMLEVRDRLACRTGGALSANVLFDFPQVGKLVRHIAERLGVHDAHPVGKAAEAERVVAPGASGVAIIGIACRFPGGASSPEKFWSALCDGADGIGQIDALRWDAPKLMRAGALATGRAGILEDIDRFDCELFGISPREAHSMDPQQRLLLEVGWEALERAGYDFSLRDFSGGVFVGPGPNDYARRFDSDPKSLTHHLSTGNAISVTAGRLAFLLDWHGPAMAVDTACSSSLMAVHLAANALKNRECDIALAGGVNLLLSPETSILLSTGGMLAKDGRCKTFDAAADGYVRSEGCGMVVLKRLDDALAAGDDVLAVIRASAANQDGHSQGLTAPNGQAQQAVLRRALAASGLRPEQIEFLEAHGTGTPLGDPIEMAAIQAVYGAPAARTRPLAVSSVKTNIGHAEAAAGVAGLIKAVLCLKHATIVPHVHFKALNPEIAMDSRLMEIPTRVRPWKAPEGRYAAVSSFGFSGTNVHVILEAFEGPSDQQATLQSDGPGDVPLRVSAANLPALRAYLSAFRDAIPGLSESEYRRMCVHSWRRASLSRTLVLAANTSATALEEIDRTLADDTLLQKAVCPQQMSDQRPVLPSVAFCHAGPTYPFARERFWLAPPAPPRRHPIGLRLGAKSAATVTYAVDFENDPPYPVDDHIVHGVAVVPAAAHLALLIAMVRDLTGLERCEITDVVCEQALVVAPDMEVVSYTFTSIPQSFEPASGATASYEVRVASGHEHRELIHLRARVAAHSSAAFPAAELVPDPVDATETPLARIEAAAFYDELYEPQIALANSFRRLGVMQQFVGRCVAQLNLEGQPGLALTPGELDSLLQTIALATLAEGPGQSHMRGATIPFTIEKMSVDLSCAAAEESQPQRPWACATKLVREDLQHGAFVHDITLTEPDGPRFVRIAGLLSRQISSAQLLDRAPARTDYLIEEWVSAPFVDNEIATHSSLKVPGRPVIFLNPDESEACQRLQTLLRAWETSFIPVADVAELERVAASQTGAAQVIFWWAAMDDADTALPLRQAHLLVQALRICAALHGNGLIFTLATERNAAATEHDPVSPLYGWALGLCKSLHLELPGVPIAVLDLDIASLEDVTAPIREALRRIQAGQFVAYRRGCRYALQIRALSVEETRILETASAFQPSRDGLYVVTGGLGDLGFETCRWLIAHGVSRLALIGRRPILEAEQQRLALLAQTAPGGEPKIEYHRADVADFEAVSALFDSLKRQAPIRGIIHAAGVLADGAFDSLTSGDFEAVLAPKVLGAWNLHHASRGLALDCFVLYSSLASLFGSAGQSNYCAANGFMDQLARYRRRCGQPALSINWSAWGSVGMASRMRDRARRSAGLIALEPERALRALSRVIDAGREQVGIAEIDLHELARQWSDLASVPPIIASWIRPAMRPRSAAPQSVNVLQELLRLPRARRSAQVREHVKKIARAIMARPHDHPLDDDKPFQEMGFDSLMSVELKRRIEQSFHLRVPATLIFDYPNISDLTELVLSSLRKDGEVAVPRQAAQVAALDAMDERELAAVLAKMS